MEPPPPCAPPKRPLRALPLTAVGRWSLDMGSPAFQVAGLLNEATFPLYQHSSPECWLSSGEQPDPRSVTETLSFFFLPTGKTKAMWKELSQRQAATRLGVPLLPWRVHPHSRHSRGRGLSAAPPREGGKRPRLGFVAMSRWLFLSFRRGSPGPAALTCSALSPLWRSHVSAGHAHVVLRIQSFLNFT